MNGDIGWSNVATWHDFIAHTKTHALSPGYATTGSGFASRRGSLGSAAFPLTVLRECRPARPDAAAHSFATTQPSRCLPRCCTRLPKR